MITNEFLTLLIFTSHSALGFTKNYVVDELPANFRYSVTLNMSTDNPGLTQFDIYPEDNNKTTKCISDNGVA